MVEPPRLPADLHGRQRTDRLFATVGAAVAAYRWMSRVSGRRRPPVEEVDRNLPLVVDRITVEAEGVVSLLLARPDGAPLPAWRPGAHLDLVLPSGRVRQYSLCGDPGDRARYRIATRRIPGGSGSAEVHGLIPGDRVTARGPRNAFPFVAAEAYLFIAGGIGITPILPMVRRAAATGADWRLVYTGRTLDSMPFRSELAGLPTGRIWLRPDTDYGMPASGAELLEHAPPGATVYCCGPVPMITGVRLDLPGSPARAVHFERFSAPPIVRGKPFTLRLARSGTTLPVPADRSALDVVREAVPGVAYSCRQGFCRTCKVRVLDGEPEHRDNVLTAEERARGMLLCVSRAAEGHALTLDL
ncbi:PDR/VanB family oxidoreductase [Amycolatopsis aidingensis]|uniref:PDR/VanB family oxidoreductase n=1 Tax=Amycolatopsis aidingensis TaxID=2842453 RepID=UPI001C0BBB80|nr:PDR/VanB family oxidoreductase [Amycolatopsis aidingensis]